MGTRPQALAILAAFVVIFGVVSLLVTGVIGGAHRPSTVGGTTARSSTSRPICSQLDVMMSGAVDDCGSTVAVNNSCSVTASRLDAVVYLTGISRSYELDLELDGSYNGPDTYNLSPLALSRPDLPKAGIRDFRTGAVYESISGEVTVDDEGRQGSVVADLTIGGKPAPSQAVLHIEGPWGCS